jgi:hypothetical protein
MEGRAMLAWLRTRAEPKDPPRCEDCAHRCRVARGLVICNASQPRPSFLPAFRERAPAFGGCGLRGRFFVARAQREVDAL